MMETAPTTRSETIPPLAFDGTAGLVHDLGNYIQIAMSAVRILSRHADVTASEAVVSILAQAEDSLDRAGALVRGSIVPGADLPDDDVRIDECLTQMAPLLRYATGPDIEISRLGLQNALLNLALNARDAMPGGGTLAISALLAEGPETPEVEIAVADTGTGIPSAILERVFEPRFSTKPMGGGMGLPGVKHFVERSGGRLAIDSAPGEGTLVVLRLPAPA